MSELARTVALLREEPVIDGVQRLYRFGNDYGASVILNTISHGVELAVIHWKEGGVFNLVYNTPVTSDVIGFLAPEELEEVLDQIEALPPRDPEHIAAELRGETLFADDED